MQVRLKPLTADAWSGMERYPNCNNVLRPYFTRTGSIYTGLTPEDEKRLGDALGVDLRKMSSFWKNFKVTVGKETVVLDTDAPEDELKYLFLKGHKRVKANITENKATANYYLHDPEGEAEIFNKHNRVKRQAIIAFEKMKPAEIRKALRLYGDNATNVSDAVAEDRLYARVEQNPENFFRIWIDNKNRATEYLIKEAVSKSVIRKQKNSFYFGTTLLGVTLEDAIAFIDNKENSDIKAAIINDSNINL
jgi:hypothetical protein